MLTRNPALVAILINASKSAVARPWKGKFLDYSMTWHRKPELKIAPRSRIRLEEKIARRIRS